ncbi:MAG: hypothetical protein RMK18_07695 [Armatimonadota bacterium]|nr:hypothetical protein [Armatimonadota bacterium]MCX7776659.1 hypothetical protein [Armatimonadota bacterium]MDW8025726.1 hypothetical protein [Armatimonadota bacterium]
MKGRMPIGAAVVITSLALLFVGLRFCSSQDVNYICFEAEDVTSIEQPMRIAKTEKGETEKVSGNAFIEIPWLKKEKDEPIGRATYKINISQSGVYYVWVRTYWIHGCGNSVAVAVDDGRPMVITDNTYNKWHWPRSTVQVKLTPGEHTFHLIGTEMGIKVDQIYLTTDRGYVPTGVRTPNYKVNPKTEESKSK